jgi:hypothetical protein
VDVQGRRTRCDFLDLGNGVGLSPSLGTRGGGGSVGRDFHSDETLVWMFCVLVNVVKDFVVISWSYT